MPELRTWLNRNAGSWAYETVQTCNKGAHGASGFDGGALVGDARKLVEQLRAKLR